MPDLVRIRDTKTKTESTVGRRRAEQLAERGGVEILKDADAVNAFGEPLPATTPTASTKKEQAR